jgi:molecular chaperone GrpE
MIDRDDDAEGRDPKAPPSARHSTPAGPSGPAARAAEPAVEPSLISDLDPELADDLGAEFEMRGDVMHAELDAALSEVTELRDRVLRTQAEFDNFRKRTVREREEERKRSTERLVVELLPAIDNLERAIAHTAEGGDLKHLLGGVEAVHAQILAILAKEGVEVIDPLGKPFDPMREQAISQHPDPSVPDGTVVEVFQKGYSQGGRVVRTAMVVVSTGGPPAEV